MSSPPALPEKSLVEELCQCWEKMSARKKLSTSFERRSVMDSATGNSFPGNEVTSGFHHPTGSKRLNPRGFSVKTGRCRAVSKPQRHHRSASKEVKPIYTNESNFKDLVYEHTSMRLPSPTLDFTAQSSSPLSPYSFSDSSMWDTTQQTSSPATPHSIQSSTESPRSSTEGGYTENGTNRCSLQIPSSVQAKLSFLEIPHTSNPYPRPDHDSGHNTYLVQQSDGTSPMPYTGQALKMSPRSFEKQLSLERLIRGLRSDG